MWQEEVTETPELLSLASLSPLLPTCWRTLCTFATFIMILEPDQHSTQIELSNASPARSVSSSFFFLKCYPLQGLANFHSTSIPTNHSIPFGHLILLLVFNLFLLKLLANVFRQFPAYPAVLARLHTAFWAWQNMLQSSSLSTPMDSNLQPPSVDSK